MGVYLNPTSEKFQKSLQSEIYIDKSELIEIMNAVIDTEQRYVCVSRPRRFGKSMALNMLAAYYCREENTRHLFQTLKISNGSTFLQHLNQYDVISVNIQEFLSKSMSATDMIQAVSRRLLFELQNKYPEVAYFDRTSLVDTMNDIYVHTRHPFIILIDEWDCIFREYRENEREQRSYLDFLRMWLKDQAYVGLAYMTGILPIKKYGTHSALNMFDEFSMAVPAALSKFYGFTEQEVCALCQERQMDFEQMKAWYDGYRFLWKARSGSSEYEERISVYNPLSVVRAVLYRNYHNYWGKTETYEALKVYIQMNYDGLKDAIIVMLADGSIPVNIGTFSNDMTTFSSRDDVLTLLIHLGYLSYDAEEQEVSIPNREVHEEYLNAVRTIGWDEVVRSISQSERLLQDLWNEDSAAVAKGIDRAHQEVSILQYNDENALSYTISLAFYAARAYYTLVRELPAGKGYADICMIPFQTNREKPAIIIELKWDSSTPGAIAQIKERQYIDALKGYNGTILLVGVNYDKVTKVHQCEIETVIL